jgi:hypothetical protein
MALGRQVITSASISSATTTTLVSVSDTTFERIYVYWVGVDTTVAGTTWLLDIKDSGASPIRVALHNASALGHLETYCTFDLKGFEGLPITLGKNLTCVSTGTPGASTITVCYEIRGGA